MSGTGNGRSSEWPHPDPSQWTAFSRPTGQARRQGEPCTHIAGRQWSGGHDDGAGRAATLCHPSGLAVDPHSTTLYLAQQHAVRRLSLGGASARLETLAGGPQPGFSDSFGTAARFRLPCGLAVHPRTGMLIVCDSLNHRLREVDPATRRVRTLAGSGAAGGADGVAVPRSRAGLATALWLEQQLRRSDARLRTADAEEGSEEEEEEEEEEEDSEDGAGLHDGSDDDESSVAGGAMRALMMATSESVRQREDAEQAALIQAVGTLCRPTAAVYAADGTLFIACAGDGEGGGGHSHGHTIRMLSTDGELSTVAGIDGQAGYVDGGGCELGGVGSATFHDPAGLALTHEADMLFVADRGNHVIRRLRFHRGPEGGLQPCEGGRVTVDTVIISHAPSRSGMPSAASNAAATPHEPPRNMKSEREAEWTIHENYAGHALRSASAGAGAAEPRSRPGTVLSRPGTVGSSGGLTIGSSGVLGASSSSRPLTGEVAPGGGGGGRAGSPAERWDLHTSRGGLTTATTSGGGSRPGTAMAPGAYTPPAGGSLMSDDDDDDNDDDDDDDESADDLMMAGKRGVSMFIMRTRFD
jgi:hypothetical protein